jgi:hypothetical protein
VRILDESEKPELRLDFDLTEGWADGVRLPGGNLAQYVLQASSRDLGFVQVGGTAAGGRRDVEIAAQALPLAAAAPYLERAGLPYWFAGGTASLVARIALAGERWSADATLSMQDPIFGGDPIALRDSFGMPIDAAIDSMRSSSGDVTLRLPLVSAPGLPLRAVVAAGLREAVTVAHRTPLPQAPIVIAFSPGRADVRSAAIAQISSIASLLEARPDAVLELATAISREDRQWFAEQAAAPFIEEPDGFLGVLRALGVRDQNARIRDALRARAAGQVAPLDEDDEEVLGRYVAMLAPIEDERLTTLAVERARRVAELVRTEGPFPQARVIVAEPSLTEVGGNLVEAEPW